VSGGSEMIAAMPCCPTELPVHIDRHKTEGGYSPAPSGFGGSPPPLRSEGCGSHPLNIHSNPGPGPFPDPRQSFFVLLWFLRSSLPSSRPSALSHRRSERPTVSVRAPSTHFIPHASFLFSPPLTYPRCGSGSAVTRRNPPQTGPVTCLGPPHLLS
jgi:hypothetical protein